MKTLQIHLQPYSNTTNIPVLTMQKMQIHENDCCRWYNGSANGSTIKLFNQLLENACSVSKKL